MRGEQKLTAMWPALRVAEGMEREVERECRAHERRTGLPASRAEMVRALVREALDARGARRVQQAEIAKVLK